VKYISSAFVSSVTKRYILLDLFIYIYFECRTLYCNTTFIYCSKYTFTQVKALSIFPTTACRQLHMCFILKGKEIITWYPVLFCGIQCNLTYFSAAAKTRNFSAEEGCWRCTAETETHQTAPYQWSIIECHHHYHHHRHHTIILSYLCLNNGDISSST